MSPDRGSGTSCLLHCGRLTVSANSEDSWKRFCLSRTNLRRLVTLAFRRRIQILLLTLLTYNLLNCLVFQKIAFLHFGVNIQNGGSPPSWILGVNNRFVEKPTWDFLLHDNLSMDTVALNCLVFEKLAFFCILAIHMKTNRWTRPSHEAAFAVASGGLIKQRLARLLEDCR